MKSRSSTAPAFVLAAALLVLPSVGAQAASWPQTTGPSLFDQDFSNCRWTADAVRETSCGFRLGTRPAGTFDISNGAMEIRVTKSQDAKSRSRHTMIEPQIDGFTNRRFAHIGSAYWYGLRSYLEDWTSERSWEAISKWQAMADSEDNLPRNHPMVLMVRNGRYQLVVRSDSNRATEPRGTPARYDREDQIDLGPVISNAWVDWVFKIKWDPHGTDGSIVVWKNGKVVYEEYGAANTFNDTRGPVWSLGINKYFSRSEVDERSMRLDDIRLAEVSEDDPGRPEEPQDPPATPELLFAEPLSETAIDVGWRDTADNESGFLIERQAAGDPDWENIAAVAAGETTFTDQTPRPGSSYAYRIMAFNSGGNSTPSNELAATTLHGIELHGYGYDVRGNHRVFLAFWNSSGGAYDIYRDNEPIETTSEEVFIDEINQRGEASYEYKVCESTNPTVCSQKDVIVF